MAFQNMEHHLVRNKVETWADVERKAAERSARAKGGSGQAQAAAEG